MIIISNDESYSEYDKIQTAIYELDIVQLKKSVLREDIDPDVHKFAVIALEDVIEIIKKLEER
jgi:hypothetical protein